MDVVTVANDEVPYKEGKEEDDADDVENDEEKEDDGADDVENDDGRCDTRERAEDDKGNGSVWIEEGRASFFCSCCLLLPSENAITKGAVVVFSVYASNASCVTIAREYLL